MPLSIFFHGGKSVRSTVPLCTDLMVATGIIIKMYLEAILNTDLHQDSILAAIPSHPSSDVTDLFTCNLPPSDATRVRNPRENTTIRAFYLLSQQLWPPCGRETTVIYNLGASQGEESYRQSEIDSTSNPLCTGRRFAGKSSPWSLTPRALPRLRPTRIFGCAPAYVNGGAPLSCVRPRCGRMCVLILTTTYT